MNRTSAPAVITALTVAHLPEVLPHEDELFGSEAWTAESYRDELADHRFRHYVVAHDPAGGLLGWAGLMVVADSAQVLTVGVVTAAQRRGIGQQLLDALVDEAERRQATAIFLEVRVDNDVARRLYERNGFRRTRTRRGYYDNGRVDAIEMMRELPRAH
jgi:ribosomal-protein-alanine N-acetyltransferase